VSSIASSGPGTCCCTDIRGTAPFSVCGVLDGALVCHSELLIQTTSRKAGGGECRREFAGGAVPDLVIQFTCSLFRKLASSEGRSIALFHVSCLIQLGMSTALHITKDDPVVSAVPMPCILPVSTDYDNRLGHVMKSLCCEEKRLQSLSRIYLRLYTNLDLKDLNTSTTSTYAEFLVCYSLSLRWHRGPKTNLVYESTRMDQIGYRRDSVTLCTVCCPRVSSSSWKFLLSLRLPAVAIAASFSRSSAPVTVHRKAAPGSCPVMVLAAWCLLSLDMEIHQIVRQGEETSVYEGYDLGTWKYKTELEMQDTA